MRRPMRLLAAALLLLVGATATGCHSDDTGAPKRSKKPAAKTSKRGLANADRAQKQLWGQVAAKPSTCSEGKNTRSVKSVLVTDREPTADGKYIKVTGEAKISEAGPCEGSGAHSWRVSMTLTQDGESWRPATFGYEQKMLR